MTRLRMAENGPAQVTALQVLRTYAHKGSTRISVRTRSLEVEQRDITKRNGCLTLMTWFSITTEQFPAVLSSKDAPFRGEVKYLVGTPYFVFVFLRLRPFGELSMSESVEKFSAKWVFFEGKLKAFRYQLQ